ncbi:MAG TPA: hypothetical protein VMR21_16860 [Vicinamibacteria bacterium]|nr:hypothetical protein [Vicinamibacteria bacterium]
MRRLASPLLLAAALAACGDDGPTLPSQPSGPSQATITVTQSSQGQVCPSPSGTANVRLRLPVRITESAGLGANINFIRLSLLRGGAEVERREVTSTAITGGLGTNRIAAGGTVTATVSIDFNTTDFDSFRIEFNFTDDRGNVLQAALTALDVIAVFTCTV